MGSSYCLPVRLSVIVIVSGIPRVGRVSVVGGLLAWDAILTVQPAREVQEAAAFGAERPPFRVDWTLATVYTESFGGRHVSHCTPAGASRARACGLGFGFDVPGRVVADIPGGHHENHVIGD